MSATSLPYQIPQYCELLQAPAELKIDEYGKRVRSARTLMALVNDGAERQLVQRVTWHDCREQPMEILEHAQKSVHVRRYTYVNRTTPDTVEFRLVLVFAGRKSPIEANSQN